MKPILLAAILSLCIHSIFAQPSAQSVNALIGDESFVALFGTTPDASTSENLRIATHLAYVEQMLSEKNVDRLDAQQRINRRHVLDLLHTYWTAGLFPVNEAYHEQRRPCFIDRYGNICAVGYLIEQTAGREVAEAINAKHQYDFLLDMNERTINDWADSMGLTLIECAMIQPQYNFPLPGEETATVYQQPLRTGYGIASGIVGGTNLAVMIAGWRGSNAFSGKLAAVGVLSGAVQVIYGFTQVRKREYIRPLDAQGYWKSYRASNNLSYVNIATGTATIVTSVINAAINRKLKNKKTALGLYSYPGPAKDMNLGLAMTVRM